MSTPEKKVKDKVKKVLEEQGCYYFFPATHGYGASGGFDVSCGFYGHFIGIETKADATKNPTALQERNARRAWKAGCSVLLLHKDNLDMLVALLAEVKKYEGQGFKRVCVWKVNGTWVVGL